MVPKMQTGSSLLSSTRSTRAFTASAARSHVLRSGRTRQRSPCLIVRAENVLIINTKGGGHAEIGLHLAKQLLSGGHSVTILNDGDQAKLEKKAPFSQYGTLQDAKIVWGNPADPATFPSEKFDVVYDNNGKNMDACKPAIDHFKGNVAHYVFVASAGAYKTNKIEPALLEGDARKESAGHVAVEKYLQEQDLPYTIFQPLYIYGPYTGKDYMRFFLDRLLRNRPVLIPSPGIQLTSLSHVEDVASLLAKVPGNAAAIQQQFNVSSDRYITLDGLVKALAEAAGVEANIVHYDPKAVKLGKGEGFPFRTEHFMAIVDKAKRVLGWAPTHKILDDIPELVEAYKSAGYLDADVDFSVDDKILEAVGHKVPALA